jgi:hypothetical protein
VTITVDNAYGFLAARDLMAPEAVTDGNFEATSTPRRNRNVRITSEGFGSYLIKQPEQRDEQWESLRREARFYAACTDMPAAGPLRASLPRMAFADVDTGVLALELLADAEPLWQHYEARTADDFPIEHAEALGRALAVLHGSFHGRAKERDPALAFLGDDLPIVLAFHQPNPRMLGGLGPAAYRLVGLLQTEPGLQGRLAEVAGMWRSETVIHGDVKLDNILVRAEHPSLAESSHGTLCLVDWELVQFGDPAWDLGAALQDFLAWWIVTLPRASTVEKMLEGERFPLSVLIPGSQRFWHGYTDERALGASEADALLARAVGFAAARLVQTAFEAAGVMTELPAISLLMLQLAANMWRDLPAAATDLFGLPEGA